MKTWRLLTVFSIIGMTGAQPVHADALFVPRFLLGTIDRFDIPSGAHTQIVTGYPGLELGACSFGPHGQIYIAINSLDHRLLRFNQDGTGVTEIILPGGMSRPEGVAIDGSGGLLVASVDNVGLWFLPGADPANNLQQLVPPWGAPNWAVEVILGGPHQGAILVAAETRVVISEPPGNPVTTFIPSSAFPSGAQLIGLATNEDGIVFVSWRTFLPPSAGVRRFSPNGVMLDEYVSGMSNTHAIAFDSNEFLYVVSDGSILRIAPDRTQTVFASLSGFPSGAIVCRDQRVPSTLSCDAGGPYSAECSGTPTPLQLAGVAASSAGLAVQTTWTTDCPGGAFSNAAALDPVLQVDPFGCQTNCTATLTVSDGVHSRDCSADVVVHDTTPPSVTAGAADLACLWPPNHRYVCFTMTDFTPTVSDACSDPITWRFAGCASDQCDDAPCAARRGENGDGSTTSDCVVAPTGDGFCVRAERAGTDSAGRHYAVSVVATDACGNTSAPTVTGFVYVPHDQGCR